MNKKENFTKEEFIKSMETISKLANKTSEPIRLTTKQYESLEKRLGGDLDKQDRYRIISNALGRKIILID